jgi:hypothetical protein
VVSRNHDTTVPLDHVDIPAVVEAVTQLGKEAATHRFTREEKRALSDIVYTYRNQGTRTSENELLRIALNTMVADYRANGENSVLARVLAAARQE